MRSVNKVTLMGYVGRDPEIKSTASGVIIANLSLATSYRIAAKNGAAAKDVTEWHRLLAFNRTAEIIRDYVKKGAPLYIEGQLQTRMWEKNGEKHYVTEIVIRELSMLGTNPNGKTADPGYAGTAAEVIDEDIPF
jgi:single-strand DNA-binding protein